MTRHDEKFRNKFCNKTDAQYSAVEKTRDRATVCSVLVPEPQPEPTSFLISLTRRDSFLHNAK